MSGEAAEVNTERLRAANKEAYSFIMVLMNRIRPYVLIWRVSGEWRQFIFMFFLSPRHNPVWLSPFLSRWYSELLVFRDNVDLDGGLWIQYRCFHSGWDSSCLIDSFYAHPTAYNSRGVSVFRPVTDSFSSHLSLLHLSLWMIDASWSQWDFTSNNIEFMSTFKALNSEMMQVLCILTIWS